MNEKHLHRKPAPAGRLRVELNGQALPMVPFVEEIVENVIVGLMESLDGYTPDAEIRIVLNQKKQGGDER